MKTLEEIKKTINTHKEELDRRFKVKTIALFGSCARNEQKPDSDIDILVEFKSPVSLLHIVSLENYLSDILGAKTDVVPKKNLRKEFREAVLREAVLV